MNFGLVEIPGEGRRLQHLPIGSLKIFGTNPYGESLFRVVWSESRDYIVGADHVVYDGNPANDAVYRALGKDPNVTRREFGYKRYPLYPTIKAWILERWKSAVAATGCATQEQYARSFTDPATGLLTLGPYPERGEYYQCFTFPVEPGATVVYEVITRILATYNYSYEDLKRANDEQMAQQKKDRDRKVEDVFHDSQQAFKNRPTNIRPGKRTKDKINMRRSAEEVGLTKKGFYAGNSRSTRSGSSGTQGQER